MGLIVGGTEIVWYENTIYFNGSVISSPTNPNDVYLNGAKLFGLTGFSSETSLYFFGLAPDSPTFENTHIPALTGTYGDAFDDYGFETGPGGDTRWYYRLNVGYRFVTSDGTFEGGTEPLSWNGETWTGYLWEGGSVTGASTSHNGGTNVDLRRDDGL